MIGIQKGKFTSQNLFPIFVGEWSKW